MKTIDEEIKAFASVGGFCRTKELATFLGTTCDHVRNLCNEDRLAYKRIPGCREYYIQRASILGLFNGETTSNEGAWRGAEEERPVLSVLSAQGRTRATAQG